MKKFLSLIFLFFTLASFGAERYFSMEEYIRTIPGKVSKIVYPHSETYSIPIGEAVFKINFFSGGPAAGIYCAEISYNTGFRDLIEGDESKYFHILKKRYEEEQSKK